MWLVGGEWRAVPRLGLRGNLRPANRSVVGARMQQFCSCAQLQAEKHRTFCKPQASRRPAHKLQQDEPCLPSLSVLQGHTAAAPAGGAAAPTEVQQAALAKSAALLGKMVSQLLRLLCLLCPAAAWPVLKCRGSTAATCMIKLGCSCAGRQAGRPHVTIEPFCAHSTPCPHPLLCPAGFRPCCPLASHAAPGKGGPVAEEDGTGDAAAHTGAAAGHAGVFVLSVCCVVLCACAYACTCVYSYACTTRLSH